MFDRLTNGMSSPQRIRTSYLWLKIYAVVITAWVVVDMLLLH